VRLITHIDLDHFILCRRLALLEILLILKIKFLSSWITVEWLNVFFSLHLTGHVGEELLEDNPYTCIRFLVLASDFQSNESEKYDSRDFSDSESD